MTETTPNQNNPTGVWQGLWAELFRQIFEQYTAKQYKAAYESLQLLKVAIPPECEEDVQKAFNNTQRIINKETKGYCFAAANENKIRQLHNELPPEILKLLGLIRSSLYKKNWINKDFSIHPRQGTTHIRCPTE